MDSVDNKKQTLQDRKTYISSFVEVSNCKKEKVYNFGCHNCFCHYCNSYHIGRFHIVFLLLSQMSLPSLLLKLSPLSLVLKLLQLSQLSFYDNCNFFFFNTTTTTKNCFMTKVFNLNFYLATVTSVINVTTVTTVNIVTTVTTVT